MLMAMPRRQVQAMAAETQQKLLGGIVVALWAFSPNLYALCVHGTADLLLAHGYTMEEWIQERRGS